MPRCLEMVVASVGLLVLSPLFVLCAILVAVSSPGPIFFRQTRVGQFGKPFQIIKFRSMIAKPRQGGSMVTAAGDARITPIGRLLRRSKLDELPQLYNILKGDMSCVGPRPEVPDLIGLYPETVRRTMLSVRPGITDAASIFYRNEETELASQSDPQAYYRDVIVPRKAEIYCETIPLKSTVYDLKIILRTLAEVAVAPRPKGRS